MTVTTAFSPLGPQPRHSRSVVNMGMRGSMTGARVNGLGGTQEQSEIVLVMVWVVRVFASQSQTSMYDAGMSVRVGM